MTDEYTGLQDLRWQISELNLPFEPPVLPQAGYQQHKEVPHAVFEAIVTRRCTAGTHLPTTDPNLVAAPATTLQHFFPLAPFAGIAGYCPSSRHQQREARNGLSRWPAGINPDTAETCRTIQPLCLSQTAPRIHPPDYPEHRRSIRQFSWTLPCQIPGKSLRGFRVANHW